MSQDNLSHIIDARNLISAGELGRIMKVSERTVNRLAKAGKIPGFPEWCNPRKIYFGIPKRSTSWLPHSGRLSA